MINILSELKQIRDIFLINRSDLFDKTWYKNQYPDVAKSKINPIIHYIRFGWKETRDPSPMFSSSGYLLANPDVSERMCNPLVHYIRYGRREGRNLIPELHIVNKDVNFDISTKILENWLISTEQKYGGFVCNLPRKKTSPLDLRSPETLAKTGMQGGDRMDFHGYGKKYAEYLLPFLINAHLNHYRVKVVEIGILRGTGLSIWSELFPNGSIIGLDIDLSYTKENLDNLCELGAFAHSLPELYEFDQYQTEKILNNSILDGEKIDICIDDGAHSNVAILNTFAIMLPHLGQQFVYFIEDNKNVHQEIKKRHPGLCVENFDQLTIVTRKRDRSGGSNAYYFDNELSDVEWTKKYYLKVHGHPLDLKNAKSFNELLNVYKLNYREKPLWKYADKYLVRDYVKQRIGEKYLIPLIGVYESGEEINYTKLPSRFVLKATHGSGWNIVCLNKKNLDIEESKKKIKKWESENYYNYWREWAYKDIPPRFLVEKLLVDTEDNIPEDYKIFCFSGKPTIIQVDFDRFSKHTRNFYDTSWQKMPFTLGYPSNPIIQKSPDKLDEMIDIAEKLSAGFPFVRIDLYSIPDVFFGEMTFYPEAGFKKFLPDEWDYRLGEYWI